MPIKPVSGSVLQVKSNAEEITAFLQTSRPISQTSGSNYAQHSSFHVNFIEK